MDVINHRRHSMATGIGLVLAVGMVLTAGAAHAAGTLDGPVDLGTASTFGVLGASTVTNTGPSVISGDVGVSPGTAITGFTGAPNGTYNGALHQTDGIASGAQTDLTTAYNTASGLTPTQSGLAELNGLSLTPGVYAGGALSLANGGVLTLAGDATSVWVFQAASTLTIGSGSEVIVTGGASSCNVFWRVGSSATLGTTSEFVGTIMANQSITATTGATIAGRLLANTAAVTLDSNVVTTPTGCESAGAAVTSAVPTNTPTPTTSPTTSPTPAPSPAAPSATAAPSLSPTAQAARQAEAAASPATPTVATVPSSARQPMLAETGGEVGLPFTAGMLLLTAGGMLVSIRALRRRSLS